MTFGTKTIYGVAVVALCGVLVGAVAGCSHSDDSPEVMRSTAAQQTGIAADQIAAVVGGEVITHADVNRYNMVRRASLGITDNSLYQAYLADHGITDIDMRRTALRELVDDALVRKECSNRGIVVDPAYVEGYINSAAAMYPTQAAWEQALSDIGYTKQTYVEALTTSMLYSSLADAVLGDVTPTTDQLQEYANDAAPLLVGRRSSHIVISASDGDIAADVLSRARAGEDFAKLALEYSIDGTASDGGDVGWQALTMLSSQYTRALQDLQVGEVCMIRDATGYDIIMCTDIYEAPFLEDGTLDYDAIPADLRSEIARSCVQQISRTRFAHYLYELECATPLAIFSLDGDQIDPSLIGLMQE